MKKNITVDAIGDACPIPVVKTKNAIKEMDEQGGVVKTLVDNEIAVQNLTKMANQKGYKVSSEKISDNEYHVTMEVPDQSQNTHGEAPEMPGQSRKGLKGLIGAAVSGFEAGVRGTATNAASGVTRSAETGEEAAKEAAAPEETVCMPDGRKQGTVVVISSRYMGSGNDELGAILMKSFIYALSQQEVLPETILFYNSGAYLTCEESPSLDDIKSLEAEGVEILTCGTCLNFYGLKEKLKVGEISNMYDIVEKMTQAGHIVKP